MVVSMQCLKVGFSFGVLSKDLSRLESAMFGVKSFRGCVNAVFESWLLLQSVTQRPTSITVSDVW